MEHTHARKAHEPHITYNEKTQVHLPTMYSCKRNLCLQGRTQVVVETWNGFPLVAWVWLRYPSLRTYLPRFVGSKGAFYILFFLSFSSTMLKSKGSTYYCSYTIPNPSSTPSLLLTLLEDMYTTSIQLGRFPYHSPFPSGHNRNRA